MQLFHVLYTQQVTIIIIRQFKIPIVFSYNRIVSHGQITQKIAFADYTYVQNPDDHRKTG